MAFSKYETYSYALDNEGKRGVVRWLKDVMVLRGWTVYADSDSAANFEEWFLFSRMVTYTDGTQQNYRLGLENEYNARDVGWYSWVGPSVQLPDYINAPPEYLDGTSNWFAQNEVEGGQLTAWFDDASDAYLIYTKTKKVMAFQFPDGGWINAGPNTDINHAPGTRPYVGSLPFSVTLAHPFIKGDISNPGFNAIVPKKFPVTNRWTDYCALSVQTSQNSQGQIAWEDQSGTWKMLSEALATDALTGVSVVKIDSQYYLNTGQFLLPAGTTEPAL